MPLNGTEVLTIAKLIARRRGKARLKIVSLGYPDLLMKPSFVDAYLPQIRRGDLPIRPDSRDVALGHGRDPRDVFFESGGFFAALGADLEIVDFETHGRGEAVVDLNQPLDEAAWKEHYDILIDPGTLGHCFNIATAMANVALLLKVGGFAYHQAAISFPNHGFYSLSPTFFVDFYSANGFDVAAPYCFGVDMRTDEHGLVQPVFAIDATQEYRGLSDNFVIGMYVARKMISRPIVWPIQWKYQRSQDRRKIALARYIEESLDQAPQILGGRVDDHLAKCGTR